MPPVPSAPRNRSTFFRLLGFLRPYKVSMAISILLAIGSQAAALGAILLTRSIVEILRSDQLSRLPFSSGSSSASASRGRR